MPIPLFVPAGGLRGPACPAPPAINPSCGRHLLLLPRPLRRRSCGVVRATNAPPTPEGASSPSSPLSPPSPTPPTPPPLLVEGAALSPRVLIGEFLATFIFTNVNVINASGMFGVPASAAANAAIIAALASSLMSVSGAHLNTAVTAALAATRRIPLSRALAFAVVQLAASTAATALAAAIGVPVASTFAEVAADANLARAVWFEVMPMAIIVVVLYQTAVATPAEGGVGPQLAALYIAAAVFGCASTFAGGIFNPVLAFGRAVCLSAWARHWVYWTPVPAAVAAALFCEHVFVAPAGQRKPISWLAVLNDRLDRLGTAFKSLGAGAIVAYGLANTLYYVPVFAFMWLRVGGVSVGLSGLGKAWLITWAGSQVLFAPFVNNYLQRRKSSSR